MKAGIMKALPYMIMVSLLQSSYIFYEQLCIALALNRYQDSYLFHLMVKIGCRIAFVEMKCPVGIYTHKNGVKSVGGIVKHRPMSKWHRKITSWAYYIANP